MSEANQLTAEEHKWATDLSKACAKAGLEVGHHAKQFFGQGRGRRLIGCRENTVQVENRFMMAAFAIVAKGDMKKAITRIQNWTRCKFSIDCPVVLLVSDPLAGWSASTGCQKSARKKSPSGCRKSAPLNSLFGAGVAGASGTVRV